MEDKKVFKFVLTGGSCGGKTTATGELCKKFEQLGYKVFIIPEISTELDMRGFTLEKLGREEYQRRILRWQLEKENILTKYAKKSGMPSIILCDRGALDGSAYITDTMFQRLLDELKINKDDLYKRYDAVFHLTSLAVDAPEKYENHTNIWRREDIAASRIIDKKLQEIWGAHPNRYVIDNSTNLNMKIERVFQIMKRQIEHALSLESR